MLNSWSQYPLPLTEAVAEMLSHFREETKRLVANAPKYRLLELNTGLGLNVRNGLGLWQYYGSKQDKDKGHPGLGLPEYYETDGKCPHPDNISLAVLEALWNQLQNDDRYKGKLRDPQTGEELPEELRNIDFIEYFSKPRFYDNLIKEYRIKTRPAA